jgi:hypothetical protein
MRNFTAPASRGVRVNTGCSGCIGSLVGLLFLVIGIYLIKDTVEFLPGAITAQGTIIHCSYDEDHNCHPTVKFQTATGQSITIGSSESASSYYEGKTVEVRYHPETPQDGRMFSLLGTWLLPLICAGMGLLVFLILPLTLLSRMLRAFFQFLLIRRM